MKKKNNFVINAKKELFISVIVAVKNEEKNVTNLINSLLKQNYNNQNFEVIFADDSSTDNTAKIIKTIIKDINNFHYIFVTDTDYPQIIGKKKALTSAINISKGDVLAFTDADCVPSELWLNDINNCLQSFDFYVGYSPQIYNKKYIFNKLKKIERLAIFSVSAGSFGFNFPLTCTARNMAYTKKIWDKMDGFNGIEKIKSGDDDLMLHKLKKTMKSYIFSFNKLAIVNSYEDLNIKQQVFQETRRASKFRHYPLSIQILLVLILSYYLLIIYSIFKSFFSIDFFFVSSSLLFIKIFLEFVLIKTFAFFVDQNFKIHNFILTELFYIPYFIFFGIKGTVSKIKWKN
jgi:glycosyltransferase involved in cell wall biosynthesis